MAQGDFFSKFTQAGGVLDQAFQRGVVNAEKMNQILSDVYTREMNIAQAKKDMLKSDTKSLNILKRMGSVGKKVSEQQKKNLEFKKKIAENDKLIDKLEKRISLARDNGDKALAKTLVKQRNKMKLDNEMNKVSLQQMRRTIPLLGRMGSVGSVISDAMISVGNVLGSIFQVLGAVTSSLIKVGSILVKMILAPLKKAFNMFLEMQSVVGNLAADIGLTAIESRALLNNFASLTLAAMKYGGAMKDVATLMQTFSEITGKNRLFNEREVGQLIELGLGTGLGVQGAAEIASSFDNIGISLEKTVNLTDKARGYAAKLNLNSTKVLKTYEGLVKSLTGIGFGKGLDNLTKLAAKATAIRFDIAESTKAFADAFFDPEKAVEASARMQVLGGKFAASFGDPMQLAFESMSDPSALAEKFASTVSEIVAKDSKGNYFIPPAERKTLKLAAETLGQNYEDAVATAIEQRKIADKMIALNKSGFSMTNFSEEDRLAVAGLMKVNERGEYVIRNSAGVDTLLSNLTDKNQLKEIINSRKKNEDAAIQRKNLLERLSLIVDRFMLGFSTVFTKLFGSSDFESFLQMVETAGTKISEFIMKDIMGNDGLAEGFKTITEKAKDIFTKVEKIFGGEGSFGTKIAETLKLLFKDVAIPIISEVIKFTLPILKAGIGKILEVIGGALPNWLGGSKMKNYGLEMQANAINESSVLQTLYGEGSQNALLSQMTPTGEGTMLDGGMKGFKAYKTAGKFAGGASKFATGKGLQLLGKSGANVMGKKFGAGAVKLGGKMAGSAFAKRIPVLGSLVSLGFAVNDAMEGDWSGAGLQTLSAAAGLLDLVAPGAGTAASIGIDGIDAAREMGAFDDGVIYKDGSYAKFSKGDMVQFIDQAAMERASTGGSGGGSTNSVQHSGVITIKSDDGKVVTWDQMYGARDLIGSRMASTKESYDNGFGNYQNPYISPIQPLL